MAVGVVVPQRVPFACRGLLIFGLLAVNEDIGETFSCLVTLDIIPSLAEADQTDILKWVQVRSSSSETSDMPRFSALSVRLTAQLWLLRIF